MLTDATVSKLYEMRHGVMAQAFRDQCPDADLLQLPFEERFSLLVDSEWASRKSNRLTRLIRNAGFAFTEACVEDIEYHADRKLDKPQIMRPAAGNYIQEGHNIIILGATGSGKSYLASAFGIGACRMQLLSGQIRSAAGPAGRVGHRPRRRHLPQGHQGLQAGQTVDPRRVAPIQPQGD